ncbi:MAG: hypothetical protein HYS17_11890 [Micavibrio aeruginosavorus]|uniref:DUF4199 domain-containing protein n=1 Tax=Micavibrio aeruginosavorus TaxID=349221 RepID=A0A7T5R244_9BACT|nr:MAG: hypothetical protein HYS17_11890 [Micavibrio aeruginosavorus]
MSDNNEHKPEGKSAIIAVYAFLILSTVFCFVPVTAVFTTGLLMLPLCLFAAWLLRFGKSPDSLIYNHMIYISSTIWMYSLLFSVTSSIAGFMIFRWADNSILNEALNAMMSGQGYSREELYDLLLDYARANLGLMVSAAIVCVVPVIGYIAYRLSRGLNRALKGYRLQKPQSWF